MTSRPCSGSTIGFDRLFDLSVTPRKLIPLQHRAAGLRPLPDLSGDRGFSPDEVSITAEQNVVTIEGSKAEKAEREFLSRGISTLQFKRQFNLADYVKVKGGSSGTAVRTSVRA